MSDWFAKYDAMPLADEHSSERIDREMEEELKQKRMRVVRTFHPVGQGAFYSERFFKGEERVPAYNIVYDCGTSKGMLEKAKKIVKQAFDNNDTIDYLFISHLDYDHISLVETLLTCVKCVRNIVLPLVTKEEWRIAVYLNKISGYEDAVNFLKRIYNPEPTDDVNNRKQNGFTVYLVNDDDTSSNLSDVSFWKAGNDKRIGNDWDWVLIPRNVKVEERREQLEKSLEKLFEKDYVRKKIQAKAKKPINTGKELLEELKEHSFVESVIHDAVLRNEIKGAYEKVAGGTNGNSLLLYSGPKHAESNYWMRVDCLQGIKRPCYRRYKVACVYSGDSNCDINEWKDVMYQAVWVNVGTVQLPHHGSLRSFDMTKNDIERFYFFPVSCGSSNSYGHPSGKVLAYLVERGCAPQIVTEMAGSVFMERIGGRWF